MLTRFAPAPTGWLHLGHVLNAHYVWTRARDEGGRVLLRIEDHDRIRSRPEFENGILDDLDWLGYQPDLYPTDAFRRGPCDGRQSDREAVYHAAFDLLRGAGAVYACHCARRTLTSRQSLGAPLSDPAASPSELHYPGHCRDKDLPIEEGYGWRMRMDPGVEVFIDERLGEQRQDPAAQCGDVLLRDRHGNWTYQFAVAVDDWRQEIDFVIRGVDLLASTGRQIRIARLLGRERPPRFLHHPLIMKNPDQKLSKSEGDTGVRELRARGWTASDVIAAALSAGRGGMPGPGIRDPVSGIRSGLISSED
jgi:glutamyl-tRNA synthetase/glutamyl-Q tRNA(Asp) synthetase